MTDAEIEAVREAWAAVVAWKREHDDVLGDRDRGQIDGIIDTLRARLEATGAKTLTPV